MIIPISKQECTAGHKGESAYYCDKCLDEERVKIIDEVLEIIKHNILFPISQSQKLYNKIKEIKERYAKNDKKIN